MNIESSRTLFIRQTDERRLAFTGLLSEPKNTRHSLFWSCSFSLLLYFYDFYDFQIFCSRLWMWRLDVISMEPGHTWGGARTPCPAPVWSRSQMTFIQYPVKTARSKVSCLSSDHPSPHVRTITGPHPGHTLTKQTLFLFIALLYFRIVFQTDKRNRTEEYWINALLSFLYKRVSLN